MSQNLLTKFYLDKEKDIIVNIYKNLENPDEVKYVLETPYHNSGNLISNLAKLFGVETVKNENDMKIITNVLPASINGDNETVYIFRLGGIKIANIYENGKVEIKAKIPAIAKTLMSQTKDYKIPIEKTLVKSYILKKDKFRTDLHTHMNANLNPDVLISLGIKHQLRYPLYYIKKLKLKITPEQEKALLTERKLIEKQYKDSNLQGKYLTRKIDDNTFINFADLILNNIENADYNISKIRISLAILKDGQAVFTNLEKLYIYRYVFCKGISSAKKIELEDSKIELIPEADIKKYVKKMLNDTQNDFLKNITLRQDKLLWIAREYQKQGIKYVEMADTDLVKANGPAIKLIEEIHEIMPYIEKETDVKIRFLAAMRRIPLTIIKDQIIGGNYLRTNLDVLKTIAKSPYVVGSDFVGEEINDITDLKPAIAELVKYVNDYDKNFTIRIHAGENDNLRDNVANSIKCVKDALAPGQKMPKMRIGHGLYTAKLSSEEGQALLKEIKDNNVVLEFQITSNVRLNNLINLKRHPIKKYLENGISCVQGTDGCGFYGVDTIDEQLALQNLLGLDSAEFQKMRKVEDKIIFDADKYFEQKSKKFNKFLNGRTINEALTELEEQVHELNKFNNVPMRINKNMESENVLADKIHELPIDMLPIIIAGGSFSNKNYKTIVEENGKLLIKCLLENFDPERTFFVIGHKLVGYEKELIEYNKKLKNKFKIYAIIPKMISEENFEELKKCNLDGIRISIESDEMGIYKSFNYEIFERRESVVIAFCGNSSVSNLVQEAKNGKGKSKIFVNTDSRALKDKARNIDGYVKKFTLQTNPSYEIISELFIDKNRHQM